MAKLVVIRENKTKFLGIGGTNRRDNPHILPTKQHNYVMVGKGGKFQRASLITTPRIANVHNNLEKKDEQPTEVPIVEEV